jgi:Cys-tRNA(Pro)/Cys-tRNA(Cys) deacylase
MSVDVLGIAKARRGWPRPQLETGPAVALFTGLGVAGGLLVCSAHTPFFLLRRIGLGDSDPEPSRQNRAGGRDGRPSKLLSSNSGGSGNGLITLMSKTTRATLALARLGVKFALHTYDYDSNADRIGLQAAEALGVEPRRLLKTLMAEVDGKPVCVVVPSHREVSMKKLAAAFAGKAANMMRPADAERLTGYHVGGISPFAQKKRVPVAIDQAALAETSVYLNGGQRGLQIELDPNDAVRALDATVQPLTG